MSQSNPHASVWAAIIIALAAIVTLFGEFYWRPHVRLAAEPPLIKADPRPYKVRPGQ